MRNNQPFLQTIPRQCLADLTLETLETLDYFTALTYSSRVRFVVDVLPLLQSASPLRRVVAVFANPLFAVIGSFLNISLDEVSERHIFPSSAQAPRFPPSGGDEPRANECVPRERNRVIDEYG
ncbi:hypothetical protein F4677DRAFT_443877 [Hypoxylon crocopeplum]|nr:hypothetical protein F4677DRAFT_443877 [Hypoxylon crocopeplum]